MISVLKSTIRSVISVLKSISQYLTFIRFSFGWAQISAEQTQKLIMNINQLIDIEQILSLQSTPVFVTILLQLRVTLLQLKDKITINNY